VKKLKYASWKGDKYWVGYLLDHPHYWTQGEGREDLEDHLRDIYQEVLLGNLPADDPDKDGKAIRIGELVV